MGAAAQLGIFGALFGAVLISQLCPFITFSLKDYGSMNGVYTVAGDISGEYKDNKLVLDYTFKHAGQMVGTIHFEGTKK